MSNETLLNEYIKRRDELIERKNYLLKLKKSRSKQTRKVVKKQKKTETVLRSLDTYEYSKSLISNYSRLPEMDMDIRLKFARMTCPWMSVTNIKKEKLSSGNKNDVSFITTLNFDTLGDFKIELNINSKDETIQRLDISSISDININENKLILKLIRESIDSNNISRFVYGINTLLRMRHKRKRAWMSIFNEIDISKIKSINGFPIIENIKSKDSVNILLFNHSPSFLEIEFISNKIFRIDWNIKFQDNILHCVSDFTAIIFKKESPENLYGITRLLKNLIKAKDIKLAVIQILNILYNV